MSCFHSLNMIQHPPELGGSKVGAHPESSDALDIVDAGKFLESAQGASVASIRPDETVEQRLASGARPAAGRLALVGNANRLDS